MNMRDYQRKVIEAYLSGRDVICLCSKQSWIKSNCWAGSIRFQSFILPIWRGLKCDSSTRRYHYLKRARAILLRFIPPFSSAMAFLDDLKLSLTSWSFWKRVSFLSTHLRHKIFVQKPSLKISFSSIDLRWKQAFVFFRSPEVVFVCGNLRTKLINLRIRCRRNIHTLDYFCRSGINDVKHSKM